MFNCRWELSYQLRITTITDTNVYSEFTVDNVNLKKLFMWFEKNFNNT